jgi:hypothetical protein
MQTNAEVPFEIRGVSIGNILVGIGGALFTYTMGKYLLDTMNSDVIQIAGFVYALPILLLGASLKEAEVDPVPVDTKPEAVGMRAKMGNEAMKQMFGEATRHFYGDSHFEEAFFALGLEGKFENPPPLISMTEQMSPETGGYMLSFLFDSSDIVYAEWKKKAPLFGGYFGPGVRTEIRKVSSQLKQVEMSLITIKEGESDLPQERMADGTLEPIELPKDEFDDDEYDDDGDGRQGQKYSRFEDSYGDQIESLMKQRPKRSMPY